ncbi:MAG: hypothetical protein QG577_318 [Thermodesulfobacteriota bacterium]|nr:hypothetical protein [Thermodesulfobacteriota bacterium]
MAQPTLSRERIEFLKEDYQRGFIRFCGLRPEKVEWGRFESRVHIVEDHRQQDGFIHAGVMATMADHTAGYSAFTTVPEGFQILTIEFKINFLKPAYGHSLKCLSQVIREGRQIIVAESNVLDVRTDQEVLVAKAMVTLMAVSQDLLSRPTREK